MPVYDGDLPGVDEPFVSSSEVREEENARDEKLVSIDSSEVDIQALLRKEE